MKLAVQNTRALTLADVQDLPAPEPSRHKQTGIPCGCCGAEVYHSRANHTTIPVCEDCRRGAELAGRYVCRDADHSGERIVSHGAIARQWRDPLLDICVTCFGRRHPYRKVTALDEDPHRDQDHQDGSLESFVSGSRLVATWIRTG
jgi:hypothetical protein